MSGDTGTDRAPKLSCAVRRVREPFPPPEAAPPPRAGWNAGCQKSNWSMLSLVKMNGLPSRMLSPCDLDRAEPAGLDRRVARLQACLSCRAAAAWTVR